jgi:hypothetical protein
LDSYLPEALEKGCVSVHHPVQKEIFLLLWVAQAWKWANASQSKASFWNTTLTWVRNKATEENWSNNFSRPLKGHSRLSLECMVPQFCKELRSWHIFNIISCPFIPDIDYR